MRLIDADAFDEVLQNAQTECKKRGGNFRYGVLSNVRANLAKMPTVGGWISVTERLPEMHEVTDTSFGNVCTWMMSEYVLVWAEDHYLIGYREDDDAGPFWMADEGGRIAPTYWMPLPEPPKEEKWTN